MALHLFLHLPIIMSTSVITACLAEVVAQRLHFCRINCCNYGSTEVGTQQRKLHCEMMA